MARKLTPAIKTKIRRLRARGMSRDEIALKVGLSQGSITRALAGAESKKTAAPIAPPVPAPEAPPGPPPTMAELAAELSQQLTDLRGDAARARAAGDDAALARAQRHAATTATTLARLTRDAPEADGFVLVERAAMDGAAERARDALRALVQRGLDESAKWPTCPTCGQPRAPGEVPC